jgi:hypothetical protein
VLTDWEKFKNKIPPKYTKRKTEVDLIQHRSMKQNFPSPCHYNLTFHESKKARMALPKS